MTQVTCPAGVVRGVDNAPSFFASSPTFPWEASPTASAPTPPGAPTTGASTSGASTSGASSPNAAAGQSATTPPPAAGQHQAAQPTQAVLQGAASEPARSADPTDRQPDYHATVSFYSIPFCEFEPYRASSLITDLGPEVVDCTVPKAREVALTVTCPKAAIAAPGRVPADLPVVVFIHGGRYEEGSHDGSWYQGVRFAESGCVFVSVGYRLGLEGFATFSDDAPGQYRGIGDCLVALEWVQKNIEAFGGDPTNVTLMGQSAGAAIALWLARKDHFRGGFRRIIASSPGFPRQPFSARKGWLRTFLSAPVTRRSLIKLSAEKPAKVARAYRRFRTRFISDAALGPYPWENHQMHSVPVLLCHTRDEFYPEPVSQRIDRAGWSGLAARLWARSLGLSGKARTYVAAARAIDPDHVAGRMVGDSTIRRWVCDVADGAPGEVHVAELVNSQRPAVHCADLPLVFGCFDRRPERVAALLGDVTPSLMRASDVIHGVCVDFARGVRPPWPAFAEDEAKTSMVFDVATAQGELAQDRLGYVRAAWPMSRPAYLGEDFSVLEDPEDA